MNNYIILLFIILILCLGIQYYFYTISFAYGLRSFANFWMPIDFQSSSIHREPMTTLDEKYLYVLSQQMDSQGKYFVPSGYYDIGNNFMATIPPGYTITSDNTGIISNNITDIMQIPQDTDGNYTIPVGYYKINDTQMASIPYGFIVNKNGTGITINPTLNIINSPIGQNSPTTNLTDSSYNDLIKYNSNNFDINYHENLKFDDELKGLKTRAIYYEPGAFKYGGSTYVPNYEESIYLSKNTIHSTITPYESSPNIHKNICIEYKHYPNRLENACNNLDKNTCKLTDCCLLLGGEKCVSGNNQGPYMKYNYSDFLIKNRDYYYYHGLCYGNCPYYTTVN
jgi:hypothetical protein